LSGFTGDFDAILANDNPAGPALVDIVPSDIGFTSQGCGTWVLAETARPAVPTREFGDGMWRVGIDIAPGTYRSSGAGACYWERLSGFKGDLWDIIANDFAEGSALVTIEPSDAGFSCSGCGKWTPAG